MGVPLVRGNWPPSGALFGVVVNQAFARQVPGIDATGRHIGGFIPERHDHRRRRRLQDTATGRGTFAGNPYMPFERLPLQRSMRVVVRTAGPAAPLAPAVRRVAAAIDRTQPVYEMQTLETALSDSIAPRRFNLFLLGTSPRPRCCWPRLGSMV